MVKLKQRAKVDRSGSLLIKGHNLSSPSSGTNTKFNYDYDASPALLVGPGNIGKRSTPMHDRKFLIPSGHLLLDIPTSGFELSNSIDDNRKRYLKFTPK